MAEPTLYFAYTDLLDPERLEQVAPGAQFRFVAHYPETRLAFVERNGAGPTPTLLKESGNTVWGGVFEIPSDSIPTLTAAETAEGRVAGFDVKAVDREGNKYDCLTFVATSELMVAETPPSQYVDQMVRGARHWDLPAGWVMGLEDLNEDPLFS